MANKMHASCMPLYQSYFDARETDYYVMAADSPPPVLFKVLLATMVVLVLVGGEHSFHRLDLTGKCSIDGELVTAPQLGCGFQCFILILILIKSTIGP